MARPGVVRMADATACAAVARSCPRRAASSRARPMRTRRVSAMTLTVLPLMVAERARPGRASSQSTGDQPGQGGDCAHRRLARTGSARSLTVGTSSSIRARSSQATPAASRPATADPGGRPAVGLARPTGQSHDGGQHACAADGEQRPGGQLSEDNHGGHTGKAHSQAREPPDAGGGRHSFMLADHASQGPRSALGGAGRNALEPSGSGGQPVMAAARSGTGPGPHGAPPLVRPPLSPQRPGDSGFSGIGPATAGRTRGRATASRSGPDSTEGEAAALAAAVTGRR